jgi:hypothetical protein
MSAIDVVFVVTTPSNELDSVVGIDMPHIVVGCYKQKMGRLAWIIQ